MFLNLLSKSEQKKLSMIELLLHRKDLDSRNVADKLGINQSLVEKYLSELMVEANFLLIDYYTGPNISLTLAPSYAIDELYSHFLARAPAFQLLETLFYSDYGSYELLGVELNLSKSSVIRLIQQINAEIKKYDFYIAKKPLRIAGNEVAVSQFFSILFVEKYQNKQFPENQNLEQELKLVALELQRHFPVAPYFSDTQKLIIMIYVHMIREKNGNFLVMDKEEYPLIDILSKEGKSRLSLGRFEYYLTHHVFNDGESKEEIGQNLRGIFTAVFDAYGYEPEDFESLFPKILFQYLIGVNLQVPYCILNNYLHRFVMLQRRIMTKKIYKTIEIAFKKSTLGDKHQENIEHICYLFSNFFPNYEEKISYKQKVFQLGLFFDTNSEHTEYLKYQIEKFLPYEIFIKIINPLDIFSIPASGDYFDLILSNISIGQSTFSLKYKEYHFIDSTLAPQDIDFITAAVEKYISESAGELSSQ
ncbi:helix-turn-helix domain-containing protein [Vagococcus elongatus]|uniref:Mga helix-turn-helix domain-containing protein n=1 Tax=Vagococcus elongatus TaxID=180344 RepID=A0A430B120_9ENTE|nr:helix-turn-helix domain-containing protein [Vagococcus elongatus]RSU14014.1 hypothetical protein CBF29_03785 [Vagococcus elongatus]